MSGRLPESVSRAAEEIHRTTRSLILAAEQANPEAIHDAIDRRGEAVRRLEQAVAGAGLDRIARKQLVESLALQADDAEGALRGLMDETRQALGTMSKTARAGKGYAAYPGDASSALDRSG